MALDVPTPVSMDAAAFAAWRRGLNRPVVLQHDAALWPAPDWTPADVDARWPDLAVSGYVVANKRLDARADQGLPTEQLTWRAAVERLPHGNVHVSSWLNELPDDLSGALWPPVYCAGQSRLRQRLWLTAQGVATGTHQDPYDNWYTVLHGSKQFTVAAPGARHWLQPYPLWSRLPNFGRRSLAEMAREAPAIWQRYHGSTLEVRAGEMLYLPRFWWHEVVATTDTVAVNAFAISGWLAALTEVATVYRRIRKI